MKLILRFLEIANKAIKTFPAHNRDTFNFFSYMGIGVTEFFEYAKTMPISEIEYGIKCIESNEWDQSEFIMACERQL